MTSESWRGAINMLIYSVELISDLDNTKASITADAIIEYRTFGNGPQFFLTAIADALATDAVIMTAEWAEPAYGREDLRHSEQEMRQFLAMIADHLRRRQPWPPKPERVVDSIGQALPRPDSSSSSPNTTNR